MNERKLTRNIQGEIEKATGKKATVLIKDSVVTLSGGQGRVWEGARGTSACQGFLRS